MKLWNLLWKNFVIHTILSTLLRNPHCIDLIITNRKNKFQNTMAIVTGLSDYHKMTVTILKTSFPKQHPNRIIYRDYKQFSNTRFRQELDLGIGSDGLFNLSNDMFITVGSMLPPHPCRGRGIFSPPLKTADNHMIWGWDLPCL